MRKNFYCELQPMTALFDPEAMAVNGLDREALKISGLTPQDAMRRFGKWVREVSDGGRPVFVGFNAPFDWMFSHWYFKYFFGADPFGYSALDIEAYYMGMSGRKNWSDTKKSKIPKKFLPEREFSHNALDDALYQAEMFRRMREYRCRQSLKKKVE
jgi:hypothetical protein